MTKSLRHPLPFPSGRPFLGVCAILLGLLLSGCGGGGSGSTVGLAGACGNPDTHCAPRP